MHTRHQATPIHGSQHLPDQSSWFVWSRESEILLNVSLELSGSPCLWCFLCLAKQSTSHGSAQRYLLVPLKVLHGCLTLAHLSTGWWLHCLLRFTQMSSFQHIKQAESKECSLSSSTFSACYSCSVFSQRCFILPTRTNLNSLSTKTKLTVRITSYQCSTTRSSVPLKMVSLISRRLMRCLYTFMVWFTTLFRPKRAITKKLSNGNSSTFLPR